MEKQISKIELVSEQNQANESILASGNRLVQPSTLTDRFSDDEQPTFLTLMSHSPHLCPRQSPNAAPCCRVFSSDYVPSSSSCNSGKSPLLAGWGFGSG